MKTIEKILWHPPYSIAFLERERKAWNFNGMWTDEVNLDKILKEVIVVSFKYNPDRGEELFHHLQNLFYRHDQEYKMMVGKMYADIRLAYWVFRLLHWTKLRWLIAPSIFFSLLFSREAKRTYKQWNFMNKFI